MAPEGRRMPAAEAERPAAAAGATGVGAGGGRRRRPLALLALLALLVAAGLLIYFLGFDSGGKASPPRATGRAAPSVTTGAGAGATGTQPGGTAPPSAPSPAASPLVGGGGVASSPATGAIAGPGVLGVVLFAENGTALDPAATQVIAASAAAVRADHAATVTVIGYTDSNGDAQANQQLSLQRAQVVAQALQQDLGSPGVNVTARAEGQAQPVATNATPAGQQLNRRVAIQAG